jgi:hypothetical protein
MVGATALNKFAPILRPAQPERFAAAAGKNLCAISLMPAFP